MSPKLNAAMAKKVGAATSSFTPIPDGTYTVTLKSVDVKTGPAGPYWKWTFTVDPGKRQLFLNASLSEEAQWRLNEVFKAFGAAPDTDTDELLGQKIRVQVGTRTIQAGARAGELANDIIKCLPAEGGNGRAAQPAAVAAGAGDDSSSDSDSDENEFD
jgi:hypothetical protein